MKKYEKCLPRSLSVNFIGNFGTFYLERPQKQTHNPTFTPVTKLTKNKSSPFITLSVRAKLKNDEIKTIFPFQKTKKIKEISSNFRTPASPFINDAIQRSTFLKRVTDFIYPRITTQKVKLIEKDKIKRKNNDELLKYSTNKKIFIHPNLNRNKNRLYTANSKYPKINHTYYNYKHRNINININ